MYTIWSLTPEHRVALVHWPTAQCSRVNNTSCPHCILYAECLFYLSWQHLNTSFFRSHRWPWYLAPILLGIISAERRIRLLSAQGLFESSNQRFVSELVDSGPLLASITRQDCQYIQVERWNGQTGFTSGCQCQDYKIVAGRRFQRLGRNRGGRRPSAKFRIWHTSSHWTALHYLRMLSMLCRIVSFFLTFTELLCLDCCYWPPGGHLSQSYFCSKFLYYNLYQSAFDNTQCFVRNFEISSGSTIVEELHIELN